MTTQAAATQETYNEIKTKGLATPETPDESNGEVDGIRLSYLCKGYRTRASIYERVLPDKLTTALCLDGPSGTDNGMTFHGDGRITVMTGARDPNLGAASGKLNITAWGGGLHRHMDKCFMEFNDPTRDGQALNIKCDGDYVEQTIGGERVIKAKVIRIEATDALYLVGQSVKIQSESDIEMAGTAINTAQINKKDIVLGQKMSFGAGEETSIQFDPRSNQSIISSGHINRVIAGDYNKYVAGVSNVTVGGGVFAVPLVEDRSATYNVKTVVGNIQNIAAAGGFINTASAAATIAAGGAVTIAAGGAATVTAGGIGTFAAAKTNFTVADLNLTSAKTSFKTAEFDVDAAKVDIVGAADVSITGANVRLTGALIYLN